MNEKKYFNRAPRGVRDQYLDDLAFFANQQIDASSLNGNSYIGTVTADANGAIIETQPQQVAGRHTIVVINDSSFLIYVSLVSNPSSSERILIPSGTTINIKTNPNSYQDFYVVSPDITQDVKVIEVA